MSSNLASNGITKPRPNKTITDTTFINNWWSNAALPKTASWGMKPIVAQTKVNKKHQPPTNNAPFLFLMKTYEDSNLSCCNRKLRKAKKTQHVLYGETIPFRLSNQLKTELIFGKVLLINKRNKQRLAVKI